MNRTQDNAKNIKVVLVGETDVGKTSVISRFCNNKFESVFMPTAGASFSSKTLYFEEFDKIIKFEANYFFKIDMGYSRARKIQVIIKNILQRY